MGRSLRPPSRVRGPHLTWRVAPTHHQTTAHRNPGTDPPFWASASGEIVAVEDGAKDEPTDQRSQADTETHTDTSATAPDPVAGADRLPRRGPDRLVKYDGDGFNHYTTLRNTSSTIPKAYPPEGGAVDFGTSYTTDATKTLAYDATADGGSTYHYRATAFDAEDRVIAASSVKSVIARGVKSLGELAVGGSAGAVFLDWTPYGGSGTCFSYCKIAWSTTNAEPSCVEGDPYLVALGDQGAGSFTDADTLEAGQTYYLRVQAIRSTAFGSFLVARTHVAAYTVP